MKFFLSHGLLTSSAQIWNATQVSLSFVDRTKPSLQTHFGVPHVRGQFGIVSGNFVQSQDASHSRVNSGHSVNSSFSWQTSAINFMTVCLIIIKLSIAKKKTKTKKESEKVNEHGEFFQEKLWEVLEEKKIT